MQLLARALGAAMLGPGPTLWCVSALAWIAVFTAEGALRATVCGSLLGLWSAPAIGMTDYLMAMVAWSVLVLAMMAPALGQPITHVWRATPRRHRAGALAVFIGSYLAVWLVAGGGLGVAAATLFAQWPPVDVAVGAGAALVAWQLSPCKQVCLNRCHHVRPLAPFALPALADRVHFGLHVGFWCVGSCWAFMFAMIAGVMGHPAVMLATCAMVFLERQLPPKAISWGAILKH
jgi:predicted metal-binding membrane protein